MGKARHLHSVEGCKAPATAAQVSEATEVKRRIDKAAAAIWEEDPRRFLYSFRVMAIAVLTAPDDDSLHKDLRLRQMIADKAREDFLSTMILMFVLPQFRIPADWEHANALRAALNEMATIEISLDGM